MKLLRVTLDGQYKGLKNQTFNLHNAENNIVAFAGLNGSGKSQFLELVAEAFSYLERECRDDFVRRKCFPFSLTLEYTITHPNESQPTHFEVLIDEKGRVHHTVIGDRHGWDEGELALPKHIVGYSSGLNENLQRSFLKNAVQFYEVMRIRSNRRKALTRDLDDIERNKINSEFLQKYPRIFRRLDLSDENIFELSEADTKNPHMIYLDYDCAGLLLASLSILPDKEIRDLFPDVHYCIPRIICLRYDLKDGSVEEDAIRDIQRLISIAGNDCVDGEGNKTSEEQYDLYDLDYLKGVITLDLTNPEIKSALAEDNYDDPLVLFNRLYKIQLLGINKIQRSDRYNLLKDDFFGNVKKPMKMRQPMSVINMKIANGKGQHIDFDDLSDGEAQLIEVLSAARIFHDGPTLFLLDEPETHLNPSWRTYFHWHFNKALESGYQDKKLRTQTLMSTHSPFMISSLGKHNVYICEKNHNGMIDIASPQSETYGASFDSLIKQLFHLNSLISQSVVKEIKDHLPKDGKGSKKQRKDARDWIEANLGNSMEKTYLLTRLKD